MQQRYGLQPPADYMVRAVIENLPHLSARQKLLYIGVLTVIAALKERGELVTSRRVTEEVSSDESNIGKIINELVAKGVIAKVQTVNRLGKGKAFELVFVETPLLRELYGLSGFQSEL